MSNELLDFTARDNFNFFKFSVLVKDEEEKTVLKRQCESVLEYAHATVQDMCLLGWQLKELKESKTWESVFEPKSGYCFSNFSFQAFCEYAFGFSKTRTSNLLRIAEFVKIGGTKGNGFIDERYAGYNTSQLVELAPVVKEDRRFFSAEMSVEDMRYAKNYMKWGDFWERKREPNFDIMTAAKEWEEKEEAKKQSKAASLPGVLPGQVTVEEVYERDPTSDLASDGDEDEDWQVCGWLDLDEYDEEDEAYEDMQGEMQTIEEESERSIAFAEPDVPPPIDVLAETEEPPKYDFSSRDKIREFLYGYQSWGKSWELFGVLKVYSHHWKNGMRIYAVEYGMQSSMEQTEATTVVRYFWKMPDLWKMPLGTQAFEIAKEQLWKYIAAHKDEL